MSRVYSAITGAARPAAPTIDAPGEGEWDSPADAPFVEIGGPGGPVSSVPAEPRPVPAPPRPAAAEAKPSPMPEPERAFPRLAPPPAPTYLSVRFHDIGGRPARVAADGPDASLVTLHFPEHPVSGEYRVLRDEIRRQLPDSTSRVLLFSAAASESGTTTVLMNLAVTLAAEGGSRVLAVDGNVHRPATAAKLALKPAPGLCEVLAHHVPLTWAVQPTVVPGLEVLAAGEPTDATPAAVCRDLPKLLAQLRQWYDWVLVDGGVWGEMAERDAACPSADAVYLVTREGSADRPVFTSLRGWVKELGGLLRGYVTTRV
jgi:Mrp family chromosome partitioning ATPase